MQAVHAKHVEAAQAEAPALRNRLVEAGRPRRARRKRSQSLAWRHRPRPGVQPPMSSSPPQCSELFITTQRDAAAHAAAGTTSSATAEVSSYTPKRWPQSATACG